MGRAADNDYCPNCGSQRCSASCYYDRGDRDDEEDDEEKNLSSSASSDEGIDSTGFFPCFLAALVGITIICYPGPMRLKVVIFSYTTKDG